MRRFRTVYRYGCADAAIVGMRTGALVGINSDPRYGVMTATIGGMNSELRITSASVLPAA